MDVDEKNVTGEPRPRHFSFRHGGKVHSPLSATPHTCAQLNRLKTPAVTNRSSELTTRAKTQQ